jgi:hypothetical protein
MIAITTNNSIRVKPRRNTGGSLAEGREDDEGQPERAAGGLSSPTLCVWKECSSLAPARCLVANAAARLSMASAL